MAGFLYTYFDEKGAKKEAFAEADSENALTRKLDREGVLLVEIKSNEALRKQNQGNKTKVKPRELTEFCIYMLMMTEAGVPLTTALKDFEEETKDEKFAGVIAQIHKGIHDGESLSHGLRAYPQIFSIEFVELIKAGEKTGTLENAFRELQGYLEWQEKIKGEIRQATLYPKIIASVLGLFILFLFSSVIPGITAVLLKLNIPLPTVTVVVMAVSDFLVLTWWVWILVFALFPFLFKRILQGNEKWAFQWDHFKLKIPIIGELLNLIVQARFIQNFAIIHRAGIPIIENLELCSGFVGNKVYAKAISKVRNHVREGVGLTDSMKGTHLFTGLVIRMMNLGETTGNLDTSLLHATEYYNRELPRRIKKIFSILEPMMILTLVGIVGVVALSIFLPILSISGSVR